ncbi:hypothetical protein GCM10020295_13750 [Streptomyces cinereospinus]
MPRRLVECTIDGREARVPAGSTVSDSCRAAGKDVPPFRHGDTVAPRSAHRLGVRVLRQLHRGLPHAALSFRSEFGMRAAGTRDGSRQTAATTVCACRGVGRNRTLHVQDNETVEVTSPHDNPVTRGNLCIQGRFGYQHGQNRD